MKLKDATGIIEIERDEDTTGNHPVTIQATGDIGPNGLLMYRVTGKFPAVARWLVDVFGLDYDALLDHITEFRLPLLGGVMVHQPTGEHVIPISAPFRRQGALEVWVRSERGEERMFVGDLA